MRGSDGGRGAGLACLPALFVVSAGIVLDDQTFDVPQLGVQALHPIHALLELWIPLPLLVLPAHLTAQILK